MHRIFAKPQSIGAEFDLVRRPQLDAWLPSIPAPPLLFMVSIVSYLAVKRYLLLCCHPDLGDLVVQIGKVFHGIVSPFSLLIDPLKLLHVGFSGRYDGDGEHADLVEELGGAVRVLQGIAVLVELAENGAVLKEEDGQLAESCVLEIEHSARADNWLHINIIN